MRAGINTGLLAGAWGCLYGGAQGAFWGALSGTRDGAGTARRWAWASASASGVVQGVETARQTRAHLPMPHRPARARRAPPSRRLAETAEAESGSEVDSHTP